MISSNLVIFSECFLYFYPFHEEWAIAVFGIITATEMTVPYLMVLEKSDQNGILQIRCPSIVNSSDELGLGENVSRTLALG